MEKIGFIQRFRISIFDVYSYKKIMKDSLAKAILFMFLITIVSYTIPLFSNIDTIKNQKKTIIEQIKNKIDVLEVKDSKLVFPEDVVKIELDSSLIYINKDIIYDEVKEEDLKDRDLFIGVLKDEIVIKSNGILQKTPYTLLKDFSLNSEQLIEIINYGLNMGLVIVSIITIISSFIGYLIKALMLASIGSISITFKKKFIKFSELYKCGLYSLALPVIFCTLVKLINININWSYFYYIEMIAGLIYTILAISNYEDDNKEELIKS